MNIAEQEMENYSRVKNADYTREADVYDSKRFASDLGRFYVDLTNAILYDLLQVRKEEKILDLATGTGRVAVGLAERGVSISGVDLTWKMLQRAKEKVEERKLKNVSFHVANALHLPYKDNTFDKIVSIRFFHILPFVMQKAIVREVARVLKPGGFFVAEFNSPFAGLFLWAARRDHQVIWPRQIKALFNEMIVVKKVGIMLPGVGRVARMSRKAGERLGRSLTFFPFNHLSNQILIVAKNPASVASHASAGL
ncbi:MAG: class I SAM-dependent methyltransferase [Candidatus Manganitrophus sp.]|nr:class I SAM-dependent methyltransferase [Candidatus Manganitrophus sp.]WDT69383.1 MAG: class I SAM-dependent methyltransferase [Candidatus Manganitrophus sp.]WDT79031.1 MAG: class I SAM-dependent methyltransferase [Candidatus Manganitrophus sp.]